MLTKLFSLLTNSSSEQISRDDLLKKKPLLNSHVSAGINSENQKVIIIPREKRVGMFSSFLNDAPPKQLVLDEVGYYVFDLIDGKRTINNIVKEFSRAYQVHEVEAQTSVIKFLSMLKQRGVLVLAK